MSDDRNKEIAECAYRLWESEGRPAGKDVDHWLRAERELTALEASRNVSEVPKPAKATRRKAAPKEMR